MFLVIILTFFPQVEVQYIGIVALWAFFIVAAGDAILLGFLVTRKLRAKFGDDRVEKVRWYAAMRPSGMPMTVRHSAIPVVMCPIASQIPATISQRTIFFFSFAFVMVFPPLIPSAGRPPPRRAAP